MEYLIYFVLIKYFFLTHKTQESQSSLLCYKMRLELLNKLLNNYMLDLDE